MNLKVLDIVCVVILVIAVAAGGGFLHLNYSRHSSRAQLEKEVLSDQKNQLKLATEQLEQLQTQFAQKQDRVNELDKRVPKAPGMGELLSQLHARVNQRDIALIDFSHQPSQVFERYKRIPVQIVVNGAFLSLYRLIHDLETLNRVFIFENIVIKRQENQDTCQAVLMASVFQQ